MPTITLTSVSNSTHHEHIDFISSNYSRCSHAQVDPVAQLLQANRSGDATGEGGAAASAEVEKLKEKLKVFLLFMMLLVASVIVAAGGWGDVSDRMMFAMCFLLD